MKSSLDEIVVTREVYYIITSSVDVVKARGYLTVLPFIFSVANRNVRQFFIFGK